MSPSIDFEHVKSEKNEKHPRFFSFFRFEVLKIGKGMGFPGEPGRTADFPPVYGGWVCWIDFMLHIVEIPSKRPYPGRSGSILVELSNRLYDSVRKSKSGNPNWRSVSTIPIGIWILDPRSELIQGTRWQKGTEVSKCVESDFCASKHRKSKNAQNEILDVRL